MSKNYRQIFSYILALIFLYILVEFSSKYKTFYKLYALAKLSNQISNNSQYRTSSNKTFQKYFEKIETLKLQNQILSSKVSEISKYLKNLEKQIKQKQIQVENLNNELKTLDVQITKLELNINTIQNNLDNLDSKLLQIKQRLKSRFIYLYTLNQTNLSKAIFSSNTYEDFIYRYNTAKYLIFVDKQKLSDLKKEHQQKLLHLNLLNTQKNKLSDLAKQKNSILDKLDTELKSLSSMYETLVLEKKIYAERQAKLAKTMQELENEIIKIENMKTSTQSNGFYLSYKDNNVNYIIKTNNQIKTNTSLSSIDSNKVETKQSETSNSVKSSLSDTNLPIKVQFNWPVDKDKIIDVTKSKENQPQAITIKINTETEVKASASGRVMFKGPLGTLGNVVIIAHNQGFNTVYGYLDDVWVGLGQEVEKNETIGRILGAKNNKLYFEIRLASRNLDPLSILPKIK